MSRPLNKTRIQTATGAAGKGLADLVKLLETGGRDISQEEFEKIFTFLRSTFVSLETQARRDRALISASNFSFDMETPAAAHSAAELSGPQLTPPPVPPSRMVDADGEILLPLIPAAAETLTYAVGTALPVSHWKKPTGRISKNSPNTELAGQAVHIPIKSAIAPNTLDGVGVVGDKEKKAGPVGFIDN